MHMNAAPPKCQDGGSVSVPPRARSENSPVPKEGHAGEKAWSSWSWRAADFGSAHRRTAPPSPTTLRKHSNWCWICRPRTPLSHSCCQPPLAHTHTVRVRLLRTLATRPQCSSRVCRQPWPCQRLRKYKLAVPPTTGRWKQNPTGQGLTQPPTKDAAKRRDMLSPRKTFQPMQRTEDADIEDCSAIK